jgi:hypothetical protein
LKFLFLELDYSLGYMMRVKSSLEFIPVVAVRFFMGIFICIPPIRSGSLKLVRLYQNLLSVATLDYL